MPKIRTAQERTDLVAEAIAIDKELSAQLTTEINRGTDNDFVNVYTDSETEITVDDARAASERVQRIISTLIEEENFIEQNAELVKHTTELVKHTTQLENAVAELASIDTNTKKMAQELATIDTNINTIRTLGETVGFRTISPYGWLGIAITYLQYVKQGLIFDEEYVSPAEQAEAIKRLKQLMDEVIANFEPINGGFKY